MLNFLEGFFIIGFKVEGDVSKVENMGFCISFFWYKKRILFFFLILKVLNMFFFGKVIGLIVNIVGVFVFFLSVFGGFRFLIWVFFGREFLVILYSWKLNFILIVYS